MEQDNLLQGCSDSSLECWRKGEVARWYESVRGTVVVALLLSLPLRLITLLAQKETPGEVVAIGCVTFLCTLYAYLVRVTTERLQKAQMMFLFTINHAFFITVSTSVCPSCIGLWSVTSCLVFFLYEFQSFYEQWVLALLLIRQFAMWFIAFRAVNACQASEIPLVLIALAVVTVYGSARNRKHRADEMHNFLQYREEQEGKLKSIVQAVPVGLLVATADGDFPCFNSRLQQVLGATTPQDISKTLMDLPRADEQKDGSILQEIHAFLGSAEQCRTLGTTKIWGLHYEWKGTKCTWGNTNACILSASDISSWMQTQKKLKQDNDAKDALLRFVSHELRTPTNAILNLVQNVLMHAQLTPEQRRDLSIVLTSTHLLLSVVNDLLDFTRILANKFSLQKAHIDIRSTLREALGYIELQCQQKHLTPVLSIDPEVPQVICSDPYRLKQVLVNLLRNAVRFTFHGGIKLVAVMTERETLKITVEDSGVGISSEKLKVLTQALRAVSDNHVFDSQQCGLGLYISNYLVSQLGSTAIDVRSKVGIGSQFSFELWIAPIPPLSAMCTLSPSPADIAEERECVAPMHCSEVAGGFQRSAVSPPILIVDDIEFNRLVLRKMLQELGLRADEACSGLHAVTLLQSAERRSRCYRLVLMDVEMPIMDGIEATQRIRELERAGVLSQRTKIVACSAHRNTEDIERCLMAGMDRYLEKPVSRSMLHDLLADRDFFAVSFPLS